MTPRIYAYLIVGALLIGNVLALKYLYDRNLTLSAENDRIESERDVAVNKAWRLDALLAEKLANDAKLAEQLARLSRGFKQEKKNDPELAAWAAEPLPAGTVRFLRERGRDESAGESAGSDTGNTASERP